MPSPTPSTAATAPVPARAQPTARKSPTLMISLVLYPSFLTSRPCAFSLFHAWVFYLLHVLTLLSETAETADLGAGANAVHPVAASRPTRQLASSQLHQGPPSRFR